MTIPTATTAAINKATTITALRRLGLTSPRVVLGGCCVGNMVVGAVPRFIAESVVCGRTLVSISLDTGAEPNFIVPASALTGPESLIKAVPSVRQNTSASSVSTRLHAGQRFIIEIQSPFRGGY